MNDNIIRWDQISFPAISETELYLIQQRVVSEMVASSMNALKANIGINHHPEVDVPPHV